MNLSRAAKKFRAETPAEPKALKPVKERKLQKKLKAQAPTATPEPVAEESAPAEVVVPVEAVEMVAAPAVEPVAAAETSEPAPPPAPKKVWPVKAKRPRFVREQAERRERTQAPALPTRSSKLTARMMTQKLALPPKEDANKLPR